MFSYQLFFFFFFFQFPVPFFPPYHFPLDPLAPIKCLRRQLHVLLSLPPPEICVLSPAFPVTVALRLYSFQPLFLCVPKSFFLPLGDLTDSPLLKALIVSLFIPQFVTVYCQYQCAYEPRFRLIASARPYLFFLLVPLFFPSIQFLWPSRFPRVGRSELNFAALPALPPSWFRFSFFVPFAPFSFHPPLQGN